MRTLAGYNPVPAISLGDMERILAIRNEQEGSIASEVNVDSIIDKFMLDCSKRNDNKSKVEQEKYNETYTEVEETTREEVSSACDSESYDSDKKEGSDEFDIISDELMDELGEDDSVAEESNEGADVDEEADINLEAELEKELSEEYIDADESNVEANDELQASGDREICDKSHIITKDTESMAVSDSENGDIGDTEEELLQKQLDEIRAENRKKELKLKIENELKAAKDLETKDDEADKQQDTTKGDKKCINPEETLAKITQVKKVAKAKYLELLNLGYDKDSTEVRKWTATIAKLSQDEKNIRAEYRLYEPKKKEVAEEKDNGDTSSNKIGQYDELDVDALYRAVRQFAFENGLSKKIISKKILAETFGKANIAKLITKSYLIDMGKGVTFGNV